MPRVATAFMRRDWLVWTSYRFNAFTQIAGVLVIVALLATIGESLLSETSELIGPSDDYVAFLLAGIAFTDVFFSALTAPPNAMRDGQMSGTIEPILLTPVRSWEVASAPSIFATLQAAFRSSLVIAVAIVFLDYWRDANVPGVVLVLVPGWLSFLGLGLVAAAFVVTVKQGEPVVVGYVALSAILGGTVVPLSALPEWMHPLGELLPLTHALDGLRAALAGAPLNEVLPEAAILATMAAVLVPVGLYAISWSVRRARKEGTLVHY